MYRSHFVYSFICWWTLGCFSLLAVVSNAAVSIGVYLFKFLLLLPVVIYTEVELRDHIVLCWIFEEQLYCFLQWLGHSHSHLQCTRVSISLHPSQHLFFSIKFIVFIIAVLMSVKWYFIVFLICVSPVTSNVEHLFIYLLATCVSLEKCLFKSFAHFELCCFGVFVVVVEL